MGSSFIFLAMTASFYLVFIPMGILSICLSSANRGLLWLREKLIWNLLIRFFTQQYVTFLLSTMISFYQLDYLHNGDCLGTVSGLALGVISLGAPAIFLLIVLFMRESGFFKKYLSCLIEDVHTQSGWAAAYNALVLLRWETSIIILVAMRNYPGIQITLLFFQSLAFQAYVLIVQPFEAQNGPQILRVKIFNEGMICLYLYCTVALTDNTIAWADKLVAGWGLVVVTLACALLNILQISYQMMLELRSKYRRFQLKRKSASLFQRANSTTFATLTSFNKAISAKKYALSGIEETPVVKYPRVRMRGQPMGSNIPIIENDLIIEESNSFSRDLPQHDDRIGASIQVQQNGEISKVRDIKYETPQPTPFIPPTLVVETRLQTLDWFKKMQPRHGP